MKYLIFEDSTSLNKVILFDEITDHVEMKNRMPDCWTLISAGKISMNGEVGTAIPGSVTLRIVYSADGMTRDNQIIQRTLQFQL